VLLAPTVNLHRTPHGGRGFECFSEDPLLTARIGVAYVRGLQRAGVGATVKHFVGNDSETQRRTVPPSPAGVPGVAVCVEVRNTGPRRGREVVQVYASRPDSAVERPVKWLAGFAAVDADPGETVDVGILIPERAFQHWTDQGWATEPGPFALAAGPSSASLPLIARVEFPAGR